MSMFCYQCEQKAKDQGCKIVGVCGKDVTTAKLQDTINQGLKSISVYYSRARKLGERSRQIDHFIMEMLFTTVTNVNFDSERLQKFVNQIPVLKEKAKNLYKQGCAKNNKSPEQLHYITEWNPAEDLDELLVDAESFSIPARAAVDGDTIVGLQELVLYSLKGVAAYADHAMVLGHESEEVYDFFAEALKTLGENEKSVDVLLGLSLKTGEVNLKVMELLDQANTSAYGHPEPTQVRVTPVRGKAILVSGHDLKDLYELLKQTEGKGINIYTHGEMLPANAYPELKRFSHLVGNYGGAWQDQEKEFDQFPGSILMTTNCIQKPAESYKNRIFTTGLVAWPGVQHISDSNFALVIDAALQADGFNQDSPEQKITIGFGHNAVMNVAGTVIEAVKSGAIKHFYLVGGCDGAKPGRNYFTDFAKAVPKDCVILTLACGKYRFNKENFGDIGGIPRLLDIGQCNDAYSAIKIASALADAFNTDVNGLPLSFVLSWYEQKAVAILLTLLHLGVKNIRLGPTLPAFITPDVLNVLVEKFKISPITTVEQDLKILAKV